MSRTIWTYVWVLSVILVGFVVVTMKADKPKTSLPDVNSVMTHLEQLVDFSFTCPKCQSHQLLFKPNPVTIERRVGAVVEVTGEWFCAVCLHPAD